MRQSFLRAATSAYTVTVQSISRFFKAGYDSRGGGKNPMRRIIRRALAGCVYAVFILQFIARAVTQSQASEMPAVSQPVTVNVAVTRHGQPVKGLTKADFVLLEDGRPQTITSFQAVDSQQPAAQPETRTIVLFRVRPVFSPHTMYATVKGTDLVPAGTRIALTKVFRQNGGRLNNQALLLGLVAGDLVRIHDFTRDGHALEEALSSNQTLVPYYSHSTDASHLLDEIAGFARTIPGHKTLLWLDSVVPDTSSGAIVEAMPSLPVLTPASPQITVQPPKAASKLPQDLLAGMKSRMEDVSEELKQADMTLDLVFAPYLAADDARGSYTLNHAQINTFNPQDEQLSALGKWLKTTRRLESEGGSRAVAWGSLLPLAWETGGQIVASRSDAAPEIEQDLERAGSCYELRYVPANQAVGAQFRKIEVRVNQPSVEVFARNGYYAAPAEPKPAAPEALEQATLTQLMERIWAAPPPITSLSIMNAKAEIVPNPGGHEIARARVVVDLDGKELRWNRQSDGSFQCQLEIAAKDSTSYPPVIHEGILNPHADRADGPVQAEILVPLSSSAKVLRVAVRDEQTGRMGWIQIGDIDRMLAAAMPESFPAAAPLRQRPEPPMQAVAPRKVTLNVTATDRHGIPVAGLSAADFAITEDGRPQKIDSFEAVEQSAPNVAGQPQPQTTLVFNKSSDLGPHADVQSELIAALSKNHGMLPEPTKLFEVGDRGLVMLHDYTRDGNALVQSLRDGPPLDSPVGLGSPQGWLQQVAEALQEVPGHKTVIWISSEIGEGIGPCGPIQDRERSLSENRYRSEMLQARFNRNFSNLLFTGDITLDVLLHPQRTVTAPLGEDHDPRAPDYGREQVSVTNQLGMESYLKRIRSDEPEYGSAIFLHCGSLPFAFESGGMMASDSGSTIDKDLEQSMIRAANYYTLTYSSSGEDIDGQFRRIQVSVDRPSVKVYARNGYYAMPNSAPLTKGRIDRELASALDSSAPFTGVTIVRAAAEFNPERTAGGIGIAQVEVYIDRGSLSWTSQPDGSLQCTIDLAAREIPASKTTQLPMSQATIVLKEDPRSQNDDTPVKAFSRLPITTPNSILRVVVLDEQSGRIGTAEIHNFSQSTANSVP
jgi:VWFA-related protein